MACRSVGSEWISKLSAVVLDFLGAGVQDGHQDVVLAEAVLRQRNDTLAGEEVADRTGIGDGAAVAGDGEADFGGGTVLVVGEALDQQRRALRAAAFVHDLGVVHHFAGEAGAALDGAVDVVSGDRGLLGLGDGEFQARVAGEVRTAHACGDFDVLDQLGERLGPAAVEDGLLVLGRRPFGVA